MAQPKKVYLSRVLIIALLIVIALMAAAMLYWPDCKTVVTAEKTPVNMVIEEVPCVSVPCEPVPCEPVPCEPTATPENTDDWDGDKFGPEMPLPDLVVGPAIANLWNEKTGFCATVKINDGVELNWKHSGGYWEAGSQEALDARWPHHRQEYQNQSVHVNCQAITNINLIPTQ